MGIAHVESPVGRVLVEAGMVPVRGRLSLVFPTTIEAAPMIAEVLGHPEIRRMNDQYRATTLVVFDSVGGLGVTFERYSGDGACVHPLTE